MALATGPGGTVVLFGGDYYNQHGSINFMGDTWTWDGAGWTQQHPVTAPSPRCCVGVA
jgi:hypothetical protein